MEKVTEAWGEADYNARPKAAPGQPGDDRSAA